MRAVKMVLAVLCFVLGAAFAFGAVETIFYSRYDDSEVFWLPAIFAAIFCLGGFLLLRRPQVSETEPPNMPMDPNE
jgi:peptidoglycan/LPS O-acetylase OafA/YrhL